MMQPHGQPRHPREKTIIGSMFHYLFTAIKSMLIGTGILVLLLAFLLGFQARKYSDKHRTPEEKVHIGTHENIFLTYKLDGKILESSPRDTFFQQLLEQLSGEPQGLYLPEFREQIKQLKEDDRVKGLLLDISGLDGSFSAFAELRDLLLRFRQESGKPLLIWLNHARNKNYFLASVADQIFLAPLGDLSLPGPGFELPYFGEALRKLGIDIEIIRSGTYKSAFEAYVANRPSKATTEMYHALVEDLEASLAEQIAAGRSSASLSVSPQQVISWFRRALFTPDEALANHLIDQTAYFSEIPELFFAKPEHENTEDNSSSENTKGVRSITFQQYLAATAQPVFEMSVASASGHHKGIALIEANGEIQLSAQGDDNSQLISPDRLGPQLTWAREEENVKGVLLRINSPGGSALASDLIWKDVARLAAVKPLVVSMGAVAASGGYYIAAPAKKIFAGNTTITGSIGVIGMIPKVPRFEQKYGVSFHSFSRSDRSSLLNPGSHMSDEDRHLLTRSVDYVYQEFLSRVAEGRSMSRDAVDQVARGRVWTGRQAKELGLVDEIGNLDDALAALWALSGFPADKAWKIYRWEDEQAFPSLFLRMMHGRRLITPYLANLFFWLPSESGELQSMLRKADTWRSSLRQDPIQMLWTGSAVL
ncbi:MAG: signal peptide peptidase SppA [Deltaproteobacteria bacterium]|nr:signal peptide peptidase SppA [Deltaproteobacteria bacterium]